MHHTHHSPTTHHSPLATHHSPHAPLASPRTTRHAPLTTHHSPLAEKRESGITAAYTPGKPFAIDGDQRRRAVPIDSEDMVVRHAITEMSKHGEMWGRDARGPAGVIHMLHTCTHARPSTHTHNHDLTPHPRALPPGLLRKPNCKLGTWHRDFPHFGHVARKPATCFIVLEKGNGVCCAHTLTSPHPIPPNLTTSPPPPTPTPTSTPHPPPPHTHLRTTPAHAPFPPRHTLPHPSPYPRLSWIFVWRPPVAAHTSSRSAAGTCRSATSSSLMVMYGIVDTRTLHHAFQSTSTWTCLRCSASSPTRLALSTRGWGSSNSTSIIISIISSSSSSSPPLASPPPASAHTRDLCEIERPEWPTDQPRISM